MWRINYGHFVVAWRKSFMALLLLFFLVTTTEAQPSSSSPSDNYNGWSTTSFNPSVAILIIVLICAFFFLGFFSVYIRNCSANSGNGGTSIRGALATAMARSRRQRGLDATVLETFPKMIYSEVKEHKIGKGSLECAVCLSEFEDEENIRLLPKCSHVFHSDCIDEWLSSHVTCPVCRCNLMPDPSEPSDHEANEGEVDAASNELVDVSIHNGSNRLDPTTVVIDVEDVEEERRRRQEDIELERIGSQRRAVRAKSVRQQQQPMEFSRSHTTGHSLITPPPPPPSSVVRTGDSADKYTLRLPDHIRREIIASGQLKRVRSLHSFPTQGEASSRRGHRVGVGNGDRGLGRSDRWPSFITRTFSSASNRVIGKRTEITDEGSVKKLEGSEGSNKSRQGGSVRVPFDCLGVLPSGSRVDANGEDEENETVAIARHV